jgi:hypothetical protein
MRHVAMDAGVVDDRTHLRLIGVYAEALRRPAETEGDVLHRLMEVLAPMGVDR